MSYSRHFTKTIEVHYSGVARSGDTSIPYSGTVTEPVHINIHVDTDDLDSSVVDCSTHVDALTTSVVATKTAHIASISENSKKISDTIIKGFFKTVRSELGQQMAMLRSSIDATLVHLNKLAERCRGKQLQMEADYHRITERYSKIFTDLNTELQHRVFELDRPAFKLREQTSECSDRTLISEPAGVALISSAENARIQSELLASMTKKRALDAIHRASGYLVYQQENRNVINRSLFDDSRERSYYVPVCLAVQTEDDAPGALRPTLYKPSVIPNSSRRRMTGQLQQAAWRPMPESEMERIRTAFAHNVAEAVPAHSDHDRRVKAYLNKFINNPILSL